MPSVKAAAAGSRNEWQRFVANQGRYVPNRWLAHILGITEQEAAAVKAVHPGRMRGKKTDFVTAFTLWNGREPREDEWPIPKKLGRTGYEWLGCEDALLAQFVGMLSYQDITDALNERLLRLTRDKTAKRSINSVKSRAFLLGVIRADVVGGMTVREAGVLIGHPTLVISAVNRKQIQTQRVGKGHVIPYDEFERWKATLDLPPDGYVKLISVRDALSIKSDKLSEFARAGMIDGAVQCNPWKHASKTSKWGTWYIPKAVADKLVADRHAGLQMPWHGKDVGNLKVTWKSWQEKKHPASCAICRRIWGPAGAPKTYTDYTRQYPGLLRSEKFHLTKPWHKGISIKDLAQLSGESEGNLTYMIRTGKLKSIKEGNCRYILTAQADRFIQSRKNAGTGPREGFIPFDVVEKQYRVSRRHLNRYIRNHGLKSKISEKWENKGKEAVSRQKLMKLVETVGFTQAEAARAVCVTKTKFAQLLKAVGVKCPPDRIPLSSVKKVEAKLSRREGWTFEEAAEELEVPIEWVVARRDDGTITVLQSKVDRRRLYITDVQMGHLRRALSAERRKRGKTKAVATVPAADSKDWITLSKATLFCGMAMSLISEAGTNGEIEFRMRGHYRMYAVRDLRRFARRYWVRNRHRRAIPPAWLIAEGAKLELPSSIDVALHWCRRA